jgi:hypothetical protein
VSVTDEKDKSSRSQGSTLAEPSSRRTRMTVEGEDALDLYVRQIARNLSDLQEQVLLLREACAEHEKLLREAE